MLAKFAFAVSMCSALTSHAARQSSEKIQYTRNFVSASAQAGVTQGAHPNGWFDAEPESETPGVTSNTSDLWASLPSEEGHTDDSAKEESAVAEDAVAKEEDALAKEEDAVAEESPSSAEPAPSAAKQPLNAAGDAPSPGIRKTPSIQEMNEDLPMPPPKPSPKISPRRQYLKDAKELPEILGQPAEPADVRDCLRRDAIVPSKAYQVAAYWNTLYPDRPYKGETFKMTPTGLVMNQSSPSPEAFTIYLPREDGYGNVMAYDALINLVAYMNTKGTTYGDPFSRGLVQRDECCGGVAATTLQYEKDQPVVVFKCMGAGAGQPCMLRGPTEMVFGSSGCKSGFKCTKVDDAEIGQCVWARKGPWEK